MKSIPMFVAICIASTAYADGDQLADAAKLHYEQGQTLYAAGRFAEARAEFLAGFELSKKPAFLFNAAECARLLGDTQVARDGYNKYLALDPNGRLAMLAMQRLDELGPATHVEPTPAQSQVPPPPPILPAPGPSTTPMPSSPTVSSTTANTTTITTVRTSAPDDDSTDLPRLERDIGIGLAGTGAAMIVTGAIFGYRASSLSNQVSGACANGCIWSDVAGNDSSARTAATVQWWMYGVGTAAVLGGAALYLLGRHEEAPVVIAPTPGGAAVTWGGRF